jgi:hypothetical protein
MRMAGLDRLIRKSLERRPGADGAVTPRALDIGVVVETSRKFDAGASTLAARKSVHEPAPKRK